MSRAIAIDPPACGCTECIIGLFVPLDRASDEQIAGALVGALGDHTGDGSESDVTEVRRYAAAMILGTESQLRAEWQRRHTT
jgi:hypothetical protein